MKTREKTRERFYWYGRGDTFHGGGHFSDRVLGGGGRFYDSVLGGVDQILRSRGG
jgi:hypothetical protein